MKVLDFFYPFTENPYIDSTLDIKLQERPRKASGIAIDPFSGNLLIVDPDAVYGENSGIYEVKPDGQPIGPVNLPMLNDCRPYGIATDKNGHCIWITDILSNHLLLVDKKGRELIRFTKEQTHNMHPGLVAACTHSSSIFLTDHSENKVAQLSTNGKMIGSFSFTPFRNARLVGITCNPLSKSLYLAFKPSIPERNGFLGKFGIYELTYHGTIIRKYDTSYLGFCPLDITIDIDKKLLFVISREFILSHTVGDHSHIYVVPVDENDTANSQVNLQIVRRLLWQNNIYPSLYQYTGRAVSLRWPQMPIPVYIDPNVDISIDEIMEPFEEWTKASNRKILFKLVNTHPRWGIILKEDNHPCTEGKPGLDKLVTIYGCKKKCLSSHPYWMDELSAQRNVLRHEIGHAIGFVGHSPRFRVDTMNSISGYSENISREEAKFIELLYSFPAGTPAENFL